MAPCEASSHASIFPFVSRFTSSLRHGPGTNDPGTGGINPWRAFGSGSRGSEAGAGSRGLPCRRRCALIVTAGLAASRWRRTFRYGLAPEGFGRPSGLQHSSPRTVFQITPGRVLAYQANGEGIRTFDSQINNLMLYQTELSVVQTAGIRTCDLRTQIRRSPAELHPRSQSPKRRRIQGGNAACTGGDESSNRCARFGFRDRERAYSPCDGLSQAALSWPDLRLLSVVAFRQHLLGDAQPQKVTRPSTRRPSPCGSTTTASPSRGETPVSATMFSRWVTMTRLSEPE